MIPITEPLLGDQEQSRVIDALERGWVSPQGQYVSEFEEKFASFIGTKYAFSTSTGTAALHLSLVARGIGRGDEVILPDLTWVSCANVVKYVNATPVFADVDTSSYTLSLGSVQDRLTENTAAIMPVHLYGQPCDMSPIMELAKENDLFVLEDAAEAHGATYDGDSVGSIGDAGCFSFYGNKILTTGQGGMITTDNDELAERVHLYRRDGMSHERKYYHPVIGYNYRLTNLQAAIGLGQMERIDKILSEKRRISETYQKELIKNDVSFQTPPDCGTSACWLTSPTFMSKRQRERVERTLESANIETRPFFYPLHKQPPYSDNGFKCPDSTSLSKKGLSLPSGPRLKNESIIEICQLIKSAL